MHFWAEIIHFCHKINYLLIETLIFEMKIFIFDLKLSIFRPQMLIFEDFGNKIRLF